MVGNETRLCVCTVIAPRQVPPVTTLAPHRIALNASQVPGLAVVLVGSRKDSETYVRSKKKSSVEVGIESFGTELSA